MTSTVDRVRYTRNPEQLRNLPRVTPEQCFGTLNGTPLHGFVVLDKRGEFIAWASCPVVAKHRLDQDPLAHTFERCSDSAVMARKHGKHMVHP